MKINDINLQCLANHSFGGKKVPALIALADYFLGIGPKPSVPEVEDADADEVLDILLFNYVGYNALILSDRASGQMRLNP